MNKVNELVLSRKDFESKSEFKQRLAEAITVLLESEYICKVRLDETDIIVIEYDHADQEFGTPYPYWLTPEQVLSVPLDKDEDSDSSE